MKGTGGSGGAQPVVIGKWYDYTRWILDRVDQFPKNQRFVLGTRLADAVVDVLETLSEAEYAGGSRKRELLELANRRIQTVRWLARLVADRNLISTRQFAFSARSLEECGRMVGGWVRSLSPPAPSPLGLLQSELISSANRSLLHLVQSGPSLR